MTSKPIAKMIVIAAMLVLLTGCSQPVAKVTTGGIPALDLVHKSEIRVVYQIKTDEEKNGVGAGLHYVQKLMNIYKSIGIPDEAVDVHAVLHGEAGYWLLKNDAYAEAGGSAGPNPNQRIVADLLERGVSVELCAQTMRSHDWRPEDILEGVDIVIAAYVRIIDLQESGYAYIRF